MIKKKRHKTLLLLILGFAVFLFVLFQPHWFLPFLLSETKLSNLMVRELEARLPDATRVFVGQVHFKLLPSPLLQVTNLELIDQESGSNWIHTDIMEIYLKPLPLLQGKAVPRRILLRRPRIQVLRDAAGQWRFLERINPGKDAGRDDLADRLGLPLNTLVIHEASLEVADWTQRHGAPHVLIDQVDARLERYSGQRPWRFSAKGKFPRQLISLSTFTIRGELSTATPGLDLRQAGVQADLSVSRLPMAALMPYLKDMLGIEPVKGSADLKARLERPSSGAVSVAGTLSMTDFIVQSPAFRSEPVVGDKATCDFAFSRDRETVHVKHLKIRMGDESIWGHGTWKETAGDSGWRHVAMHGENLSLQGIKAVLPDKILPPAIGHLADAPVSSGTLDISRLEFTRVAALPDSKDPGRREGNLSLKVAFHNFGIRGAPDLLPLEEVNGIASYDRGRLELQGLRGKYGHSSVDSLNGSIGSREEGNTDFTIDARLRLNEIHQLYRRLPKPPEKDFGLSELTKVGGHARLEGRVRSREDRSFPWSFSGTTVFNDAAFDLTNVGTFGNINGKVPVDKNNLGPFRLTATLAGTPVEMQGRVDGLFSARPRLDLKCAAVPGQEALAALLPSVGNLIRISGSNPLLSLDLIGSPGDLEFHSSLDFTAASFKLGDWIDKPEGIESILTASGHLKNRDSLIVESGRWSVQGAPLTFAGTAALKKGGPFTWNLRTKELPLQPFGLVIPALRSNSAEATLSGDLKVSYVPGQRDSRRLDGEIITRKATFHPSTSPQPLKEISGTMTFQGTTLSASGMTCIWRDVPITLDLFIPQIDAFDGELKIHTAAVDFKKLLTSFTAGGKKQRPLDKAGFKKLRLHGVLAVDQAEYGRIEISNFRASLNLEDGVVHIRSYEAWGLDGKAEGKGEIDYVSGKKTRFRADAEITGVSAEKYLQLFPHNRTFYTGEISGSIRVAGDFFPDLVTTAKRMTGDAHLKITATRETNYLVNLMRQVIHRVEIMAGRKDERFRLLEHNGMGGDFTISDGKFHSRNFYIKQYHKFDVSGLTLDKLTAAVPIRLKYDVEATGSYSFLDRSIDTYLMAKPFGAASNIVQRVPIAGKVLTGEDQSLYAAYFRFQGICGYRHRGTEKAARFHRLTYRELPKTQQNIFKKSVPYEKAPG